MRFPSSLRCVFSRGLQAGFTVGLIAFGLVGTITASAAESESQAWSETLERISTGVVSIKIDSTRAFDTEWNQSSQATGFVVDAERGLILTNRHVVTPGPVRAEALFTNQEEVELTAIYRDPVHDFGFYQYDPSKLKYIEPAELLLDPESAKVGRQIRVVGNDAGEQLSFLSGTIARLRRPAPEYGRGHYNDFNTYYLQAASGTSGGSSGSPVIDIAGNVVALNAGASSQAASSFFLPLDRVQRVLELIQSGAPVSRGTLVTVFRHQAFDELRRLGLQEETEATIRQRFPEQTGMLVVREIVPGGVGEGELKVGDILVQANGEYVTDFVPLEAIFDEHVGAALQLTVERNGDVLGIEIEVQDLHAITPMEYIEFGDALVHNLSYQQARHLNKGIEGVYVANPGYVLGNAGMGRGAVIIAVDDQAIETIDDFEGALAGLADRDRAAVRFYSFEDPVTTKLQTIIMDRRWFPVQRCRRDDSTGLWPCHALADGPVAEPTEPATVSLVQHRDRRVQAVAPSLVMVNYDMPYTLSGISERRYYGTGLIVDAENGLVIVDRNTVPEAMGDVRITFAGQLEVVGNVKYIHPTHNIAVVSYDPALIGDTKVRAAKMNTRMPDPGDKLWVIGLYSDNKLVYQASEVASIEPVNLPLSRTMRFREANIDTLDLINGPANIDGVIVDAKGAVVAKWSSFAFELGGELHQENRGIPAEMLVEARDLARDSAPLHSIEVEWRQLPLSTARNLGLDAEWVKRLQTHDPERRQILSVVRTVAGTPAAQMLQTGDLLLSIDGTPATRFREVERAVQRDQVELQVLRNGKVEALSLATVALDGRGVRRAAMWAGALLQAPYRDMAAQRAVEPYGVYVSFFAYGSPASRFGLYAGRRIVEVDGIATPDMDSFLEIVANRADRQSVRLTTVTWNNAVDVLTLKLDQTYWPAYEILYDSEGWHRTAVD
jgi:S1-C subfamily serine protease